MGFMRLPTDLFLKKQPIFLSVAFASIPTSLQKAIAGWQWGCSQLLESINCNGYADELEMVPVVPLSPICNIYAPTAWVLVVWDVFGVSNILLKPCVPCKH
jgi:hypothetical protein